jgi:pyruvate-ferredoxin/flavodoxin oxidoreductase
MQRQLIAKKIQFYVIDASQVARDVGMGRRINTIMQTCYFALSGVLPKDKALAKIKDSIKKAYGRKGEEVVRRNFEAVDHTVSHLAQVVLPSRADSAFFKPAVVPDEAPDFVKHVTAEMMAGRGDGLPVSALPIDGTFPSATTKWEKRNISEFVPVWDPETCIQCGNCSFVCPHGVIRARLFDASELQSAPAEFLSAQIDARGFPDTRYTLQVYAEDCTGCELCVQACPVRTATTPVRRAINMEQMVPRLEATRQNLAFFEKLQVNDRSYVDFSTVRGTQFLEPLFEFSGACEGCGETPYLKTITQLFGDRMLVANATGCSSIYGGNLPTTPWSVNTEGRGPAWSNSLFEDNAEFGLGMRVAADRHMAYAHQLLSEMAGWIGEEFVHELINARQHTESEIRQQRDRVAALKQMLVWEPSASVTLGQVQHLLAVADHLVRRSVWIVGGDGWAYDIGSGGLDHVLASGRDVNILVLDTEVYSNTGGQASKSTPLGAVAKFAYGGKSVGKKDLALQAISYGNVYVARIAMGANPQQALLALREAETYPGPSLILAYSHCIAHGIDMKMGLDQQYRAVQSGYWPLLRYNPGVKGTGENPFVLDTVRPVRRFTDFADQELRFLMLKQTNPTAVESLMHDAQEVIDQRWRTYEQLANV